MQAWRLIEPGRDPVLEELPPPAIRPGAVRVRVRAVPMLSYLGDYAAGRLPYRYPPGPFVLGTNGVGDITETGPGVYHFQPGTRVLLSPLHAAADNVEEPARILMGLTGMTADCATLLSDWRDGTLAEEVVVPASTVLALDGLEALAAERLASLAKFAVPMGGLLRGRLAAGETLVVNGATGYFGSAAVLLGAAMGAARIVAAGRDAATLHAVAVAAGPRCTAVALTGHLPADVAALRAAAGGGAHMALDLVGRARDTLATQATLRSLRRGGRLVLMGSATEPLPLTYAEVLANDWEVIGQFMYRPDAMRVLVALVRSGQLPLDAVTIRTFALTDLTGATAAAGAMRGMDCTVVVPR